MSRDRSKGSGPSCMAELWIKDHVERIGDFMPHLNRIHLPAGDKLVNMYSNYVGWCTSKHQHAMKNTSFRDIFRLRFPNVKIPAVKRFMSCTLCDNLKLAVKKAPNDVIRTQKEKSCRLTEHSLQLIAKNTPNIRKKLWNTHQSICQ